MYKVIRLFFLFFCHNIFRQYLQLDTIEGLFFTEYNLVEGQIHQFIYKPDRSCQGILNPKFSSVFKLAKVMDYGVHEELIKFTESGYSFLRNYDGGSEISINFEGNCKDCWLAYYPIKIRFIYRDDNPYEKHYFPIFNKDGKIRKFKKRKVKIYDIVGILDFDRVVFESECVENR
jgi:hypothetical protein